ncbi:16735_t:CDS:2 [Racocetra fulgida]|uniref:chitin synthase n=1 Tax=Racocetra fulgida TaxID=60492 RepID=A0A9N9DCH0_9GLOM|nr:16735_t:CDS:2 [Racocetra fulgida]
MGITADNFELILMVDADTKVAPSSLAYLVSAMRKDPTIMGCCGETRIANKTETWVTAIQVYEYYISHHLGKAFESAFGSVTCLPAPKDGAWVPLLSNPDIVAEYQKNIVTTLHEKNLLLLGEDRYLSTLMLRTFPYRKTLFIPQAVCHTIAPKTLSVLLSQRQTRQVFGENGKDEHGDITGRFDSRKLKIMSWEEWEHERHCIVRSVEKHETLGRSARYLSQSLQMQKEPTKIQIDSDHF